MRERPQLKHDWAIKLKKCAVCLLVFPTNAHRAQHVRYTHKMGPKEYYNQYIAPHNRCVICGNVIPYRFDISRPLTQSYCSNVCRGRVIRGKNHKSWKGGFITDEGYRMVTAGQYTEQEQSIIKPMIWGGSGQLLEHRVVIAIALRRPLTPNETVHHINGKRSDNRLENLQLFVGKHTRGATAAALMCPHCGKSYDEPTTK